MSPRDPTTQDLQALTAKEYYSTSEVATLCRVHKNTIIAAINRGLLPASKTPGGHNRVSKTDLAEFMRERGIPEVFEPVPSVRRVLVVGEEPATVKRVRRSLPSPQYDVVTAPGLLEAGAACARQRPDLVVLPADRSGGAWDGVTDEIRRLPECRQTRLLGLTDGPPTDLPGFDRVVARESAAGDLLETISRLVR